MQAQTFAAGTLESNGDTWLLVGSTVIPLEIVGSDPSPLEHRNVSVVGHMGTPSSAPGIRKLIVDKLVSHDEIARRAHEIHEFARGSADEEWLRAERELLTR